MLGAELEADARGILDANRLTCTRVVAVDRDSILYLNALGRPRTLWLHKPADGPLVIDMKVGFVAEPPENWHRRMGMPSG